VSRLENTARAVKALRARLLLPEIPRPATTVWCVAQVASFTRDGWARDWDLGGVFSTQAGARAACTEPGDCYWPITLDVFLGRDTVPTPGAIYPHGRTG
jgi:hypothetical protein